MQSPAFLRTVKALQPEGWQSTAENLPNEGESVLYRTIEHQAMGIYKGMNRWVFSNGEVEEGIVLLWQPL